MVNQTSAYAEYKEKQQNLLSIMSKAEGIIGKLEFKHNDYIDKLCKKLETDSFKIQVIGTFKNGKSTFINSILGNEVLPAYASPCTAVINEVKYGDEKRAVLHFKNPLPEEIPESIPQKAREHIAKYTGENVPPIEIPENEIEDYAVIPIGKEPKEMLMESPYDKIELFWPLELLKNNVEVIDSPGLNEHATRTKVTMEYLTKADAILFVLAADKLCARDEMEFIESNMKKHGFDSVFFVINRFDTLRNDRDKDAITNLAQIKLSEYTRFNKDGLFFVSALNALDGKIEKDNSLLEKSGIPELEVKLAKFLTEDRGPAKLSQPASELKRIIDNDILKFELPLKLNALNSSVDEITERREVAIPALEKLRIKREEMKTRIDELIELAVPDIERCVLQFFEDLGTNIPQWIEEYEPVNSVSVNPLKMKETTAVLIEEIVQYAKDRLAEEQDDWLENSFAVLVANKAENIKKSIDTDIESFYFELNKINIEFSGKSIEYSEESNKDPVQSDVNAAQRIAAAGVGLFVNGFAGAALGGMEGFSKDFAKGLIIQFAGYFGLAFLGFLNPLTIVTMILGSLVISQFKQGDKAMAKVKEKVTEEVCSKINEANHNSKGQIADKVKSEFCKFEEEVLGAIDSEITDSQNYINSLTEEVKKGQAYIDSKKAEILTGAEQLKDISNDVEKYIVCKNKGERYEK